MCAEDAAGLAPGKDDKQKYAGNTPLGAGSYGRAMLTHAYSAKRTPGHNCMRKEEKTDGKRDTVARKPQALRGFGGSES